MTILKWKHFKHCFIPITEKHIPSKEIRAIFSDKLQKVHLNILWTQNDCTEVYFKCLLNGDELSD